MIESMNWSNNCNLDVGLMSIMHRFDQTSAVFPSQSFRFELNEMNLTNSSMTSRPSFTTYRFIYFVSMNQSTKFKLDVDNALIQSNPLGFFFKSDQLIIQIRVKRDKVDEFTHYVTSFVHHLPIYLRNQERNRYLTKSKPFFVLALIIILFVVVVVVAAAVTVTVVGLLVCQVHSACIDHRC